MISSKVVLDPDTLRDGAVSCRRIAIDAAAVARQVKALHPPDQGVPPEAMSEVHDAMNQLQRSAIATERQALFLHQSLLLGLAADAPSRFGAPIQVPKLLSPWAQRKHDHDPFGVIGDVAAGLGHLLKGGAAEAYGMVKGTVDTVATLLALSLYETAPGVAKLLPGVTKKAKQFEAGVAWAIRHPKQTLARLGEDAVSYKLWKEGHYAEAVGHNVVAFASIFMLANKVGDLGEAVTVASEAESTAAKVAQVRRAAAHALERDSSITRDTSSATRATASGALERAKIHANVAEGQHAAARSALEKSRAAQQRALDGIDNRPTLNDYAKVGQAGNAAMQDDQKTKTP
jgi:hypothetical protein